MSRSGRPDDAAGCVLVLDERAAEVIRTAVPADRAGLLELIAEFYEVDGYAFDVETVTSGLTPLLESDRFGTVLVAEERGLAGYAALVWSHSIESGGRDALLDEIYVRERGRGTGRQLMEGVFREVRDRGMSRVFLETEHDNERARRLYASIGFEIEDSIWMVADIG